MLFKKARVLAQFVGFLCIGYFAVYGAVMMVTGAPPAWAANLKATTAITPQYISYQGTLRDAEGNLVNGTHTMIVNMYDAASGGNLVWGPETHTDVVVRDGQFSLLLGQSTPLDAAVFTKPDRFVQLTVDSVVMNPTQRLAAVPYAMAATYATTLSAPDGDPVDAVTVRNGGSVVVGDGTASHDMEIPLGGLCIDSDGACSSAGDGSLRVGGGIYGANSSDNDLYLVPDSAGDVGIGTTAPDRPLTIQGTGTNSEWISFKDNIGVTQWHLNYNAGGLNFGETDITGGRLYLQDGGNVGIGTTAPGTDLSVVGSVRGAYNANEAEYVEMTHGGVNGYINTVGDGDLDFRHDNTTVMSLSDAGNLNVDGNVSWGGHLSSLNLSAEYSITSVSQGSQRQEMISTSNSMCFLIHIQFHDIDAPDEHTSCWIDTANGNWRLNAYSDDDSSATCKARCLQW